VVSHTDEQTEVPVLTAHDVSVRVEEILGTAEREARDMIAAARGDDPDAPGSDLGNTLDDLARSLERLSLRFDAFELATAAQIEDLARALHGVVVPATTEVEAAPASGFDPALAAAAAVPEREDTPEMAAARVRAIDLALSGYTREAIANELAVSIERGEIEALLDRVLIG
jgi:hypothetical protein